MTYFLRGALLWVAAFFLIYVTLSIGVAGAWRFLSRRTTAWNASFLYGLRALPLAAAVALVVFLVVPSFLFLEPYQTGERIGVLGLGLACGGIVVLGFGSLSALWALRKTDQFLASYPEKRLRQLHKSQLVEIATATPMLLVAGICRPKLLISEQAVQLLDEGETQVAIRHELAHVSFHDNFKKLTLRAAKFPFLSGLEQRWMHAAEVAADDAAVTDESGALDLASALLKIAAQTSAGQIPELATSLVPDRDRDEALRARIERLMAWQPRPASSRRRQPSALFILSGLILLAVCYGPLLRHVHELSELFIR